MSLEDILNIYVFARIKNKITPAKILEKVPYQSTKDDNPHGSFEML